MHVNKTEKRTQRTEQCVEYAIIYGLEREQT